MGALPTGTVTFLFTDIEGSTTLLQRLGDRRYAEILVEHRRLLREAFAKGHGQEIDAQGDAFLVVFSRARDAVESAVAAQRALTRHSWPEGVSLRVRIALHTGEPMSGTGDYVGLDVHRAARICSAGNGGQILLSTTTSLLVVDNLPAGVSLHDLGVYRLKDLQQPERIFQVLHPDLRTDLSPLRAPSTPAHNLPRQLTSFIGRERDVAEVRRLLSTTTLLTLTGSGGCGKTRLALQVAAGVLEEYPEGVWLIELASLSDSTLIPQVVASALGVREVPGRPLVQVLLDYLRPRTLLLVVDNCEHLVDSCAHFVDTVLRACQGVRILATSREVLSIAGETAWRVPSLSVPDRGRSLSPEGIAEYEAVRLFVARAAAVQPDFKLTTENATAIVAVCRRLDGIPLAIELAAARVAALPVKHIAARLDDCINLLTRGSRTALPRQRTLEAVIGWSYLLLSKREQIILRRLSVFAGGWTLEAAAEVCTDAEVEAVDVLDPLTHLVLKSLVLVDDINGSVRYHLLETMRQYGRDRLQESGEEADFRKRHCVWYRKLAEQAEVKLVGAEQAAWFDRLETEHDNLRAALEWAKESGDAAEGLRLAGAIRRYWYVRGYSGEGRGWLEALLLRDGEILPLLRAKALVATGSLAVLGQSDYAAGRKFLEEGLRISCEDKKSTADILHLLAFVAYNQGDEAEALSLYDDSLSIRRKIGDAWGMAVTLNNLGQIRYHHEDYTQARSLFEDSVRIWRELGDEHSVAMALTNLGLVMSREGDYAQARSFMSEGLAIRRRLGNRYGLIYSLEAFAELAADQGDAIRTARLLGFAEALREAIGAPLPPANRANYERNVAVARSRISHDAFTAAWEEGRAMMLEEAIAEVTSADEKELSSSK